METKNKKDVVSYIIETNDFNSEVPEDNYEYWDEISCRSSLEEARAEYVKQLATHNTLRLVQETRTVISQFYDPPRIIDELERGLKGAEERIRKYLTTRILKEIGQDYFCNIQLTNGDTLTEIIFDIDRKAIEAIIYGPDECYSKELSQLSIEDQLTILKAVAEKH